jgi:hypothetical protein
LAALMARWIEYEASIAKVPAPTSVSSKPLDQSSPQATGERIATIKGTVYEHAAIGHVEPDGITVTHDAGIVKIPFTDLSPEMQQKYGYDRKKADAAIKQRAEAAAQQLQAAEVAQQKAVRDAITTNIHTIREVATDQLSFLDKPFLIEGELELSGYYNWGYDNAEPTHYSFELLSGNKKCHVYMERSKATGLRKQLVDAGGSLKGFFGVVLLKSRYRDSGIGDLTLELLDYRPPLP